jgi:hypothetical protein
MQHFENGHQKNKDEQPQANTENTEQLSERID